MTASEVAIAVPCYNQGHLLAECLQSLVAQSHDRWQAVVVDDGSPDRAQIEKAVRGVGDDRIRVVHHDDNRGLAAARNTGFRSSDAGLIVAVDADDKLDPRCLEKLVGALQQDADAELAYPDVQNFGRRNDVRAYRGPARPGAAVLGLADTLPAGGTLMRRPLFERLGGYDEHELLRAGWEDLEFYVRAFAHGCRAVHVPEPLYLHRIAHMQRADDAQLFEHLLAEYIYEKNRAVFDAANAGPRFLATFCRRAALAAHHRGRGGQARRLAWRATRLEPSRSNIKALGRSLLPRHAYRAVQRGAVRRLVPLLGYPLRGEERHRPFFIIGVARSGNTLLRRILTAHSALYLPPETFVMGECIAKFRRHGRHLDWPDLVALLLAVFEFHPEWHTFDAWLGPLHERLARAPRRQRNLAFVFDSFFRYHAETRGETLVRWGDKTPMNSLDDALLRGDLPRRNPGAGVPETLERLLRVFPDAQFVNITRDGCDVVSSFLRGSFVTDVDEAAVRWLHTVRQTRNFVAKHPERCSELRYEELLTAPEPTLQRVCSFLGVPFEPAMLQSHRRSDGLGDVSAWVWHQQVRQPINAGNIGKGRSSFSPGERERLQRILGEELAALGYAPATESP